MDAPKAVVGNKRKHIMSRRGRNELQSVSAEQKPG